MEMLESTTPEGPSLRRTSPHFCELSLQRSRVLTVKTGEKSPCNTGRGKGSF